MASAMAGASDGSGLARCMEYCAGPPITLAPFGIATLAGGSEGNAAHMAAMRWAQQANYGHWDNPKLPLTWRSALRWAIHGALLETGTHCSLVSALRSPSAVRVGRTSRTHQCGMCGKTTEEELHGSYFCANLTPLQDNTVRSAHHEQFIVVGLLQLTSNSCGELTVRCSCQVFHGPNTSTPKASRWSTVGGGRGQHNPKIP